MVALSRNVGRKRAMEMLLTGDPITAATAVEWGLINRAVPADQLEDEVWTFVEKLAASSPLTMSIGKQAFYEQIDAPRRRPTPSCRRRWRPTLLPATRRRASTRFSPSANPSGRASAPAAACRGSGTLDWRHRCLDDNHHSVKGLACPLT